MVVLLPAPPVVLLPAPAAPVPLEGVLVAPLAASVMQRSFSAPAKCAQRVVSEPAAALPPVCAPVLPLALPLVLPEPPLLALSLLESLLDAPVLAPAPAEPLADVEGVVSVLVLPLVPPDTLVLGLSALVVLGVLVLAPAPAEPLVEPLTEPLVDDGVSLLDVDGVVLPLADVDGVVCELVLPLLDVEGLVCELVLPLAAPSSRRQRSLAAPVMASQSGLPMVAAAPPEVEVLPLVCAPLLPELWPNEAPESASSAAAVELTMTFSIM